METEPTWHELIALVNSKEFVRAEKLLEQNPDLLCTKNSLGETVLHYLAVENDLEGVAWLHSRGASVNARNQWRPMVFEVAELNYKELLLWLKQNGTDFSVLDEDGQGIFDCLLDGLEQELQEPSTNERAKTYWRQREQTIRFLVENVPELSITPEQETLSSALTAREAQ